MLIVKIISTYFKITTSKIQFFRYGYHLLVKALLLLEKFAGSTALSLRKRYYCSFFLLEKKRLPS